MKGWDAAVVDMDVLVALLVAELDNVAVVVIVVLLSKLGTTVLPALLVEVVVPRHVVVLL